jgi:hypothetical protein
MSKNQTLGEALDASKHGVHKALVTDNVLNLTRDQCSDLLSGKDLGLSAEDKKSFNTLVRERVNNGHKMLPFKKMNVGGDLDPNW